MFTLGFTQVQARLQRVVTNCLTNCFVRLYTKEYFGDVRQINSALEAIQTNHLL